MNRPVHQSRIGRIRVAIWATPTEHGVWHNVTFERTYKEGEEWKSSDSYGRDDLLILAKLADLAHTWIVSHRETLNSPVDPGTN